MTYASIAACVLISPLFANAELQPQATVAPPAPIVPEPSDTKGDKAKEDKAKEDKAKEDKAKEDKAKEDKAKEDKAKEDKAKEDKAKEDKAKEDKAKVDKAKEDKAKDEVTNKQIQDDIAKLKDCCKTSADDIKQLKADIATLLKKLDPPPTGTKAVQVKDTKPEPCPNVAIVMDSTKTRVANYLVGTWVITPSSRDEPAAVVTDLVLKLDGTCEIVSKAGIRPNGTYRLTGRQLMIRGGVETWTNIRVKDVNCYFLELVFRIGDEDSPAIKYEREK
jgi:hypothetical protein